MNGFDFVSSTHAKCILAGEHSVLQGSPAIVLPVKERFFNLNYQESSSSMKFESDSFEEGLIAVFLKSLTKGLKLLGKNPPEQLTGAFRLNNTIDVGAGIGFSAALCVSISRWLAWKGWIDESQIFDFSCQLENDYHGQSSGLDIVGVMHDTPIWFSKLETMREIIPHWKPNLYISFSGFTRQTKIAVAKVKKFVQCNPEAALSTFNSMKKSTLLIEKAFASNSICGLPLLIQAIEEAYRCFKDWELIPSKLQDHINLLFQLGALAAKPTGAGDGGYVLSLWEKSPPNTVGLKFITVLSTYASV